MEVSEAIVYVRETILAKGEKEGRWKERDGEALC
jgi:hypothetical protein